jgi:hypothetical protein
VATLSDAAAIRAPHRSDATTNAKTNSQAVAAASTAAVDTTISGNKPEFITLICSADAYICFGDSAVGAATSSDWPITANVPQTFQIHPKEDRYFRVIRASGDGTLKWYRSS